MPTVFIVILNWNGKDDTTLCLESLARIHYDNLYIILVDNGSSDGSVEYFARHYPHVRLIANDCNRGFCEGNNIGICTALNEGADYVMLLNNDATLAANCIGELVAAGDYNPTAGILGPKAYAIGHGKYLFSVGMHCRFSKGYVVNVGMGELDKGQYDRPQRFDAVGGFAFMVKKAVFESIGLLDTNYFAYFEEVDFCLRARRAGFDTLYVPTAVAWHHGHRSGTSALRQYLLYRNQILFMRKNANCTQLACFLLYFGFYRLPKVALGLLMRGEIKQLEILVKAVGWHMGLFRSNNPQVEASGVQAA